MKAIFVDIDGPLAYGTWMHGEVEIEVFRNHIEPVKIPYPWVEEDCRALSEIVERTEANIVVSSDWRKFYTLRDLRHVFAHYGINSGAVIDTTSHYNPKAKMSSSPEWDRACEIASWVKAFKPKHWIAIDDIPLGYQFKELGFPKWRHVHASANLRDKIGECVDKLSR